MWWTCARQPCRVRWNGPGSIVHEIFNLFYSSPSKNGGNQTLKLKWNFTYSGKTCWIVTKTWLWCNAKLHNEKMAYIICFGSSIPYASKRAQKLMLVKGIELQKSVLDWSTIIISLVSAFQYLILFQFFMFISGDRKKIIIISWI
jgi:hypothetical protein